MATQPIAYLCSEYPAVSHTFIHREIDSLRKTGMTVHPASIRKPANISVMGMPEQDEAAATFTVLSTPFPGIATAHLHALLRRPSGYLRMAAAAARLMHAGPKSPFKAIAYFAEAGIILRWMHLNGINHIHEHFANPTAIVAMLMKSYGGISYSLSVHGPDIFSSVDSAMLADKFREAAFVRCISAFCQSQVMSLTDPAAWGKLHIVRCGVDLGEYEARPEPSNAIPELLCVGRLVPAKGQHILLMACARLKADGHAFRLTIVGDGPDRCSLEKTAESMGLGGIVSFTGAQGQESVRRRYDHSDIFVLASFAEGIPVVLMEAMAKEVPVISTRITGIPELIEHEQDGLLAMPGDAGDLAAQIKRLLLDKELRRRLGKAGRRTVAERYNQQLNNSRMADLFSTAII